MILLPQVLDPCNLFLNSYFTAPITGFQLTIELVVKGVDDSPVGSGHGSNVVKLFPETDCEIFEDVHNDITCHSYVEAGVKPEIFRVFVVPEFEAVALIPIDDDTNVTDGFDPLPVSYTHLTLPTTD